MYKITDYSKKKAEKLGVQIKPSIVKGKKIDVFRNGIKLASIGDINYTDFAATQNKEQRRLYKLRHEKTRKIKNTPSYWADQLLW